MSEVFDGKIKATCGITMKKVFEIDRNL